ncbi:uncharacterized protein [Ptychodera flava]|uniref:uncharacterized protein n=1 Tax=Ptychodera flava TaxID=63121 RepID=UPI003969F6FB
MNMGFLLWATGVLVVAYLLSTNTGVLSALSIVCGACLVWIIARFIGNIDLDGPKTPLKLKIRGNNRHRSENDIPEEVKQKLEHDMSCFVSYDAEHVLSIDNFKAIQMNTECIFARDAKLWGSCDYDDRLTLEENVKRSVPMFMKFTAVCAIKSLDGFVFELSGKEFTSNPETLGEGVRRVLTVISDSDPASYHCMRKSFIGKRGWCFEFNKVTLFITTFSPCYPSSHSRYAFGATSSFILFQPEVSFALHNIPDDTPHTNWVNPKTVRDRIRVAYKESGREYLIRNTVIYPPAHDIVKPFGMSDDSIIKWWETTGNTRNESTNMNDKGQSCPFIH